MERNILYYPTISLPPSGWLRQALLYWEKVTFLAPQGTAGFSFIDRNDDIEYLEKEGELEPIGIASLGIGSQRWEHQQAFEEEFKDILDSGGFRHSQGPRSNWRLTSRVHKDLVSPQLFAFLAELRLAEISHNFQE